MNLQQRLEAARLYVVSPDRDPGQVIALARAVLRGGADVLQLRHKTLPRGLLLDLARYLRDLTAEAGALFIVNDYVDIALIAGADGVHLGPDDMSIESARKLAPLSFLIGASASKPSAATAAVKAGADYIGCGATFSTPLKPDKNVIRPAGVAAVSAVVRVPVFAIGGIDEKNLRQLIAAGVHRVCVVRATADSTDPESATRRLRAMLTA